MLIIGGLTLNHADLGAKRRLEVTEIYLGTLQNSKAAEELQQAMGLLEPLPMSSALMRQKQARRPKIGRKPWHPVETFGFL